MEKPTVIEMLVAWGFVLTMVGAGVIIGVLVEKVRQHIRIEKIRERVWGKRL